MSALSDSRNALFVPLGDDGDDVEELVTEVASVTHRHYYDPMTAASNWTPADEAAHPRDSEGKFTKKGTGAGGLAELLHNASTLKTGVVAVSPSGTTRMIKTTDGKFRTQQLTDGKWENTSDFLTKAEATKFLGVKDLWQLPPSGSAKQVTAPKVTSAAEIINQKHQHGQVIAERPDFDMALVWDDELQTIIAWDTVNDSPAQDTSGDITVDSATAISMLGVQKGWQVPADTKINQKVASQKSAEPSAAAVPKITAKKASKSYINTNVIYKQTYADQQVVAERVGSSGTPSRLIWDAKKKKFILQGQTPTGTWLNAAEFGKGAAYDKFSKQEGWQAPTAVAAAPQPLKINTNVIYKQQYANGAVIAEKVNAASASTQRLVWDEGKKKFILQINNGPNWQTIGTYGKGDAYKKFSKETGWQTPSAPASSKSLAAVKVAAPTPTVTSVVAPKTAGTPIKFNNDFVYGDYTNGQVLAEKPKPAGGGYAKRVVWDADFDSFAVENNVNGNWTTTALYSRSDFFDGFANDQTWLTPSGVAATSGVVLPNTPGGKAISQLTPDQFNDWFIDNLTDNKSMWNALLPEEQDAIHAAANIAAEDGLFGPLDTINGWKAQAGAKSLSATQAAVKTVTDLSTPAVSTPPPPPPVKQPKGYVQHAQATQAIKFVGDIGKPKANVKTFKNTTSAGMLEIQAKSKTSWTPSQVKAIDIYTEPGTSSTGGYQAINAVLRGDEGRMKLFSEEQLKKAVANAQLIQDSMAPLAESLELHRGTGAQQFGFPDNHVSTADLKKLEGKILQDRGFVSTSVISPKDGGIPYDYGKKPIKIIVRAPEGTPAVYVTSVLPYQTQNELVLAAGTSFHMADVHAPSAAEKKLYGDQTEQVVILDVVPTVSKPDPKPLPGAAPTPSPSVVTPSAAAPPAATPTPAGLKASDLQLPIKITTGLIHTQKYQHGAVVAYSKGAGDSLSRLTWHEPTKKFQLQKQLSNGTWVNHGPYTKKAAYAAFGGQTWYAPPPGDSALGSGFPFDAAPAVTPPAAPLTGVSAQVAALEYNTPVSELNAFFFNLTPDQYGGLTSAEKMKLDDIAQQSLFNNSNPTPSAYLKMLKENAVTPSATSTPLKSQGPPAGTPIKLNTKVIHTTKYAHATVIAVKPQTSAGGPPPHRLVWNQTMKKFVLQVKTSGTDEWHLIPPGQGKTYFTKADAYKTFSPQTGWITPAPGTTAYGSPLFGSAPTPSVSTTAHTPSPSMAAPPAPKVKTPPMDAATLQKMHGTVPNFSSGIVDTIYGNFKGSGSDLVTLKTPPAHVFAALKKALDEHNSHPALSKLNLLQTLKLIDEKSTPPGGTNSGLYEKKIVDWLQTPSGKSVATKIWSGTADDADALLNGVPAPSTIGTPSAASKVFPTLSVSQAKAMQANMNMGNPWTPEQRRALYQYTGYDHVYINAVLRQAGPSWPNIKDSDDTKKKWRRVAKNAQAAMRPAAQAFTTYRRTEKDALQVMGITGLSTFADIKKLEGKIFSDKGFGSSSIDPNKWSGYLKFVIEVPEGTPVAWVDDISQNSGEYEVLFAAGTRYRIDRIEDEGYQAVLYVRVVP